MKLLLFTTYFAIAFAYTPAKACLFDEEVYERNLTGQVKVMLHGTNYGSCEIISGKIIRQKDGMFSIDGLVANCGGKERIEYWSAALWLSNGKVNEQYPGFTGTYDERHIHMVYGEYDGNDPLEEIVDLQWEPNCKSMAFKVDYDFLNFPERRFKIDGQVGLVPQ